MTLTQTSKNQNGERCHQLPPGVRFIPLKNRDDERGSLVELYRAEWNDQAEPAVQWNHVISRPNVLRGIHVHHTHWDYLYIAHGSMELALIDIRRQSPRFGMAQVEKLQAEQPYSVLIPPGVAHGFYFTDAAVLIYGVSHCWNPDDELGCRWNDEVLEIPWKVTTPTLSNRDQTAGSFKQMVEDYESFAARTGVHE